MAGSRYAYTIEEDKRILRYILDEHFEVVVKGNALWIKMEEEELCPGRTWQSLKNRFKRYIFPNISRSEFGLTQEEETTLLRSSSTPNKENPLAKRKSDPRLIQYKLQQVNRLDRRGSTSFSKPERARDRRSLH